MVPLSSTPPSLPSNAEKRIGEFAVECSGFNPWPSEAARLAWVKEKLVAQGPIRAGTYTIASDIANGDLVLLPRLTLRKQERDGGDLVAMGHVYVIDGKHADLLARLAASDP